MVPRKRPVVVAFGSALLGLLFLLGPGAAQASAQSSIVVDSTDDLPDANPSDGACRTTGGTCSLRAAISHANLTNGPNTITFAIPGDGVKTITVGSSLPTINDATGPLAIDGFTQTGARPNGLAAGSDAQLRVEVRGNNGITPILEIRSPANTVRGLAIYGGLINVLIEGELAVGNRLLGNYIGTDSSGTFENRLGTPRDDRGVGVLMQLGASQNAVGTPALADRNVLSGNGGWGIRINHGSSHSNLVQNNVIGLRPGLDGRLDQWFGVDLQWWTWGNLIGGYEPGEGNLVGGHPERSGIELSHAATGNHVAGNFIGTLGDGNSVAPYSRNGWGIAFKDDPYDNYIAENVVGGNGYGIWSRHNYNRRNLFVDNRIGVGTAGAPIPNTDSSVFLSGVEEVWHGNLVRGPFKVTNNLENQHFFYRPETTGRNRITQGQYLPDSVQLQNVAIGGEATQSSVSHGGYPNRAIDGNTNGNWFGNSVTHTLSQATPWWQVDLGQTVPVEEIVVFNRTDCCSSRLSNFTVFVSEEPFGDRSYEELLSDPSIWNHWHGGTAPSRLPITASTLGRYVRVQLSGSEILSLAEVQVMAPGFLAVDIAPDGVNNNDQGDSDGGVQAGLNWPVITGIGPGKVFGTACALCTVEVYVSGRLTDDGSIDTSGTDPGVGLAWIGSAQADGAGQFSLQDEAIVAGRALSALAIDAGNHTSELPPGRFVPGFHQGVDGTASAPIQPFAPPTRPALPSRYDHGDESAIDGRVIDLAGDGVSGVDIDLFDENRQTWLAGMSTGPAGNYRFDVGAGCYVLTFVAPDGTAFDTGRYRNRSTCVDADATSTVDATLLINSPDQPTGLAASITDRSGEPVAGVELTLFTSNETRDRLSFLVGTSTDAAGEAFFALADPGCYVATARAPTGETFVESGAEWLNLYSCVDAGEVSALGPATVDISGSDGAAIGGLVSGPLGPEPGIEVDLFDSGADGARGSYLRSTTSTEDGTYLFGVDAGCYVLTFVSGSDQTWLETGTRWLNRLTCVDRNEVDRSIDARLG